jgi:cellulose biosynthesis protein BcsQ
LKTLVLFNNKGGVGKTTLVYHMAHMLARLGHRALAVDLDPQANLTSAFFDEDRLEQIWDGGKESILANLQPRISGTGDIADATPIEVADRLSVVPGNLGLSLFEDRLSVSWSGGFKNDENALRDTSAFFRIIKKAGQLTQADIAIIDVGPNLGAVNRAAMLCADYLLVPLAADLFSLQGLRNLGPTVRKWQAEWKTVSELAASTPVDLPRGKLKPIGYVILQHVERLDRPAKHFAKWVDRIPSVYHEYVLHEPAGKRIPVEDPACLARLRNYRSLMPMAQNVLKPMFDLRAADGAIGSHAALVQKCFHDFEDLTKRVLDKC